MSSSLQTHRQRLSFVKLRPLLVSLVLVPLLNLLYLVSLNWRSYPSLYYNVIEQWQYESWLLGSVLSVIRLCRFPEGPVLLSLSPVERVTSLLLIWFLASLIPYGLWMLLTRLVRRPLHRFVIVAGVLIILLVAMFFPALMVMLPTASTAHIQVDAGTTLGPVPIQQRGFSQGGEIEMQQTGFFKEIADKLIPLHPSLIRIDHIFDYYNVYQVDANGKPIYDWTALDKIVDAIFVAGAKPLMSLSYLPTALAKDTVYGPPTSWPQWEALVYQIVYHFNVERHLNIEYWEVWNEPNGSSFWNGTLDEYLQLYESAARGARRADPTVKIGGPATASLPPESWLALPFYEQNYVIALAHYTKVNKLPLDFVSWHYYDSRPDKFIWSIQVHQQWLAELETPPELLITEWNRTGGYHSSMDTEEGAAYAVSVLTTLADTPLRTAFFFEPFDSSRQWEGRWGLIRADKTLKPVYRAFELAAKVTGDRLSVHSDHPQAGALASRNGKTFSLLLWNIKPAPLTIQLMVNALPQNGAFKALVSGVDAQRGNAYNGTDTGNLSINSEDIMVAGDGTWTTTMDMPANSVRLIELNP